MKIYCSSNNPIDKFVGKDIWVKCLFHNRRPYYVRFCRADKDDDTFPDGYLCVSLSEDNIRDIQEPGRLNDWYIKQIMTNYEFNFDDEWSVVEPLDTMTSAEIYSGYKSDAKELEDFVGTDTWVKVKFNTLGGFNDYFIKILSIKNGFITYNAVDSFLLNGGFESGFELNRMRDEMEDEENDYIDKFDLIRPIEVYTDEEIHEKIDYEAQLFDDNGGDYY